MEGLNCSKLEWIKLVCSCPPVKRLSTKLFSSVVIYCAVLLLWHLPKNLIHAQNYLAKIDGANRCWQLLTGRFWKPQHARKVHNSCTFPRVWGHMTVEKIFSSNISDRDSKKSYPCMPPYASDLFCHSKIRLKLKPKIAFCPIFTLAKLTLNAGKLESGSNRKPQFREGRKFTWTSEHSHSHIVENKANPDNLWRDMSIYTSWRQHAFFV